MNRPQLDDDDDFYPLVVGRIEQLSSDDMEVIAQILTLMASEITQIKRTVNRVERALKAAKLKQ